MVPAASLALAVLLTGGSAGAQGGAAASQLGPAMHDAGPHLLRGTPVQLMVTKEINSRSSSPGEKFKLRVNAPVVVDGVTVIPIGAMAWGEVIAVSGTSAAGGRGRLSLRLLHIDAPWGQVALTGTKGAEGASNTGGVVLGVLGFGLLGLLNKGGNATFKAGDLIEGYIDEGNAPVSAPLVVGLSK